MNDELEQRALYIEMLTKAINLVPQDEVVDSIFLENDVRASASGVRRGLIDVRIDTCKEVGGRSIIRREYMAARLIDGSVSLHFNNESCEVIVPTLPYPKDGR